MRAVWSYCVWLGLLPLACTPTATEPVRLPNAGSAVVTGSLVEEESRALPAEESEPVFAVEPRESAPWPPSTHVAALAAPSDGPGPYALDGVSRLFAGHGGGPACPPQNLAEYFGTTIRLNGVAVVNPAFRAHLQQFEAVVSEVALETYGRPPLRIRHRGAFACRSRRGQPLLLSEHALGNAIDVSGFDFGASNGERQRKSTGIPAGAFQVSVARDWQASEDTPSSELRARFLHSLIARLLAERDVFRGIITPADPAHSDHFHFDMGPHSYLRL